MIKSKSLSSYHSYPHFWTYHQIYSYKRNPRICKLNHLHSSSKRGSPRVSLLSITHLDSPPPFKSSSIVDAYLRSSDVAVLEGYIGLSLVGGAAVVGSLLLAGLFKGRHKWKKEDGFFSFIFFFFTCSDFFFCQFMKLIFTPGRIARLTREWDSLVIKASSTTFFSSFFLLPVHAFSFLALHRFLPTTFPCFCLSVILIIKRHVFVVGLLKGQKKSLSELVC